MHKVLRCYQCRSASIGHNSTAIRSPFLTIQTIFLFRDSFRGRAPSTNPCQCHRSDSINHYQIFSYSNRITNAKQKHVVSDHTYTVTLVIYALYQQHTSIALRMKLYEQKFYIYTYTSKEGS